MTDVVERLAEALESEHAAIYAYGIIGAGLAADEELLELATTAEAAHRDRRDALLLRLSRDGTTPPAALPAYELPVDVADPNTALLLSVTVEERLTVFWHQVLPETVQADDRALALDALIDCSVRATRHRVRAGSAPSTVALPGTV